MASYGPDLKATVKVIYIRQEQDIEQTVIKAAPEEILRIWNNTVIAKQIKHTPVVRRYDHIPVRKPGCFLLG